MSEPDEDICGETFDHDLKAMGDYEDEGAWECRKCGAEIYEEDSNV